GPTVGGEVVASGHRIALGRGQLVDVVRDCLPPVDVDGAAAPAFEVLTRPSSRRIAVLYDVAHADAVERHLGDAVEFVWHRHATEIQNRRRHVDGVGVLIAEAAGVGDTGPGNDE